MREHPRYDGRRVKFQYWKWAYRAVLLALAATCVSEAGLYDGWAFRSVIRFQGYNRPASLTNFPALVLLGTNIPGFAYSQFGSPSDGADLRFANSNDTAELPYEIESWNTGGISYVWVQVPHLSDTNTTVSAVWGKPGQPVPVYATNGATWSNAFVAVWHLTEPATNGQTASQFHRDSTTNRNHAQQIGNSATGGVAAGAQHFEPSNSDTINGGNRACLRPPYLTLSAWVRPISITANPFYEIYRKDDNVDLHLLSFQDSGTILSFGMKPTSGSYAELDVGISAANYEGAWHHLACTFDGSSKKVYRDGVQIGSANVSGVLNTAGSANSYIGSLGGASEFFDGAIDEVEVSSIARSSNWIWAAWFNQASNATFNAYRAAEANHPFPMIRIQFN